MKHVTMAAIAVAFVACLAAVPSEGPVPPPEVKSDWLSHEDKDTFGNVVRKVWIDPSAPSTTYERRYSWDLALGRVVEEIDIHGRRKLIRYDINGEIAKVEADPDFIEEYRQAAYMELADTPDTAARSNASKQPTGVSGDPGARE